MHSNQRPGGQRPGGQQVAVVVLAIGVTLSLVGAIGRPQDGMAGLLIAGLFGLSLGLGAAVFLALNAVVGARWYRPLLHVPLQLARTLPAPLTALGFVFVFGLGALYPWASAEQVAADPLIAAKTAWLNVPFFLARAVLVVLVWLALVGALRARALGQAPASRLNLRAVSALFVVCLAPTLSISFWDWTMSLEPEWYSTMWAVYQFSGIFTAGIAAVTLWALLLDRRGWFPEPLTPALRHDLGKLLFAFSSFWAYIWFCQYMLIWYANLPEEATWFAHRAGGGWTTLFWLNPILNWVLPFLFLMSLRAKRDPAVLAQVSLVVLAGRWLDTYLQVQPALGASPGVPVFALGATAAVAAGGWLLLRAEIGREQAATDEPGPSVATA